MRTTTALFAVAAMYALAGCGGGHPAASAPPSVPHASCGPGANCGPAAPALTCAGFPVRALAHDMRRQDRLAAVAFPVGSGIPSATVADILAGAWVDPGAYSGDLDQFVATASSVSPTDLSEPAPLSYDVAAVVHDAGTLTDDKQAAAGRIPVADWLAFKDDLAALALDCGQSIH